MKKKILIGKPNILLLAALLFGVIVIPFTISKDTQQNAQAASQYPNFKGIIEFSGGNTGTDATNPSLVGTNLIYYWSQLEPKKGQYQWSIVDNDMKPWVAAGKKVVIRITTAGWASWSPPYSKQGTPQWVFDEGVPHVTELDGAIYPQYWNKTFLSELQTFINAFAAKYDGNADIIYIQAGVGVGGEGKVDSYNKNTNMLSLWQSIGYTDAIWWDTCQKILTMYKTAFTKTPLAVMPDKIFIGSTSGFDETLFNTYAAGKGFWLQNNGLIVGQTQKPVWQTVPHPAEQRDQTTQSGDTLKQDIQLGLDQGANYILIFKADIQNSANQSTLQWGASLANTSGTTPGITTTPNTTGTTGSITANLSICAHGLGNCGDNVSPNGGNTNPKLTSLPVTLTVFDAQNSPVTSAIGTLTYDAASGTFKGTVSLGNVSNGDYLIAEKLSGFLSKSVPGITTITQGQSITFPVLNATAGDINNDNQLNILDYNMLIGCFGSKQTSSSCTMAPTSTSPGADINDDGVVDATDYNLFLREISVQKGN